MGLVGNPVGIYFLSMGGACQSRLPETGWGFLSDEQKKQCMRNDPNNAGLQIDTWFEDKWKNYSDKMPCLDSEEELQNKSAWLRFLQFEDEVFTARDEAYQAALEKYGETDKTYIINFLETYNKHLVRMCELVNPNLLKKKSAAAAHIRPDCAGRAALYFNLNQQMSSYLQSLSDYSELSEDLMFKQNQLKMLLLHKQSK